MEATQKINNQKYDDENYKWIELLCRYGSRKEFIKIYCNNISIPLAIMEYRRKLRDKGYGNVSFIELDKAYANKKYNILHTLFEKLFLEPISQEDFDYIINKLDQTKNGLQKLYNRYLEDKNIRILSIILTL